MGVLKSVKINCHFYESTCQNYIFGCQRRWKSSTQFVFPASVVKETMATPALDTKVSFSSQRQIASFDPSECPVTIIGKLANLKKIQYADVANKFTPIDDKLWETALAELSSGSRDTVSLYLNKFQVASLPSKCSRHNAPSRPQALTKLVK